MTLLHSLNYMYKATKHKEPLTSNTYMYVNMVIVWTLGHAQTPSCQSVTDIQIRVKSVPSPSVCRWKNSRARGAIIVNGHNWERIMEISTGRPIMTRNKTTVDNDATLNIHVDVCVHYGRSGMLLFGSLLDTCSSFIIFVALEHAPFSIFLIKLLYTCTQLCQPSQCLLRQTYVNRRATWCLAFRTSGGINTTHKYTWTHIDNRNITRC